MLFIILLLFSFFNYCKIFLLFRILKDKIKNKKITFLKDLHPLMLKKLYVCSFGQSLSFLISLCNYIISTFNNKYWSFITLGPFLLLLTAFHQIMIIIRKEKSKPIPYKLYLVGSFLDTIGCLFLQMAFKYGKEYLVVFLFQCKYFFILGYKIFIKKEKETISFTRSFIYILLILVSFVLNFLSDSNELEINIFAVIFTLISIVAFTMDMFIQYDVLQSIPKHHHSRTVGILGLFFSLISSSIFDINNLISIKESISFVKEKYLQIILHCIISCLVYTLCPYFMGEYSPVPFEASLLSINSYIGLISMVFNGVKPLFLAGHLACIASSVALVIVGFKDNNTKLSSK